MATKDYDDDIDVTMASEPAVAYRTSPTGQVGKTRNPLPCQYTVEEAVHRVMQATADVDAGRSLMSHEEFEKLVRSWY